MLTTGDFNSLWGFLGHPVVFHCFLLNLNNSCQKISIVDYIFFSFLNSQGNAT